MLVVRVGNLVKDGAISAVTRVFDALLPPKTGFPLSGVML
jgi:hypothetical protein